MTATERVRELLDERGVEWWEPVQMEGSEFTRWHDANGVQWTASEVHGSNNKLRIGANFITPEQAIAATLGSCSCSNDCTNSERTNGTCRNISKVMDEHGQARFACSECGAWIDSRMLWNPEYRNGESPWVSGCKLNYCPNCGRRVEVDE